MSTKFESFFLICLNEVLLSNKGDYVHEQYRN